MINIQNTDDNECFKWCFFRYLNPADYNLARITKADKDFKKKLYFKDIKFPVETRDIHKIKNTNSIGISVFGYENKVKSSKKCCEDKNIDFLLIGEGEKMFLSKNSIHSCMIIHYIVEENIFVVIV